MNRHNNAFCGLALACSAFALASLPAPALGDGNGSARKSVPAGTTWRIDGTTRLNSLTIAPGAGIAAPEGHSVTLTVNQVETGIAPGTYKGNVVLTVTDANPVIFAGMGGTGGLVHPFREALYLDQKGIVKGKSVLAAAGHYALNHGVLTGASIASVGENFNGILVTGGTYTIKGAVVDLTGNGGNDFAGFGAGIMSTGPDTTLILDGAKVRTHGAVRTAIVADKGSHLIVKNSDILTRNGTLPPSYVSNVTPGQMMDVPWMLGLSGNCRATNVLGDNTTAAYINSSIAAEGWGVLSIDASSNTRLTAINSRISITGKSGYGSYSIGDAVNSFYGSEIKVASYGVIITGGNAVFGGSTPERLVQLNTELRLGLSARELKALAPKRTTVTSAGYGVMWHGNGTVKVLDNTVFNTMKTVFLDKGAAADISVDGAQGTRLNSSTGVIVQLMDNDDPGPVMVDGVMLNKGVYHEPKGAAVKIQGFDIATANSGDLKAVFSHITLKGDFYNSYRGGAGSGGAAGSEGPGVAAGPAAAPPGGPSAPAGKNMILSFENAHLTGVISASDARHAKDSITAEDYQMLGDVTNTPSAPVNNGVIVSLNKSAWTVTGTSYLSSLTIGEGSSVTGPNGAALTLTVDGIAQPLKAGTTYRGKVVLSANERTRLVALADRVLDSMVSHDVSTVPLAREYAATENGQPAALSMMVLWRTVSSVNDRYYIVDPVTRQVFLIARVQEGSLDTLLFGRLKAQDDALSEIELYADRSRGNGGFMFDGSGPAHLPEAWTRTITAAQRPTRAQLQQEAASIFDTTVPATSGGEGCVLMENGRIVGENPDVLKQIMGGADISKLPHLANGDVAIPCGASPERPTDRDARADLIDEEQGIAVSIAVVHGMVEPYLITNPTVSAYVPFAMLKPYSSMLAGQQASGKYSDTSALRPMEASILVAEIHRIFDGKLQGMMMLQNIAPVGAGTPWVKHHE